MRPRQIYDSLRDTPEVTLIHGPFGTGKTTAVVNIGIEIISNPDVRNTLLYIVESNPAVDDIAMRLRQQADAAGLQNKNIIRAHTLNGS
jgi:DNA replication protein DnaC